MTPSEASDLLPHVEELRSRSLAEGGFASRPGAGDRADATAWSILALEAAGLAPDQVGAARDRLRSQQLPDGRVAISAEHPEAAWPTTLAVLAWHGSSSHQEAQERAVSFLLGLAGLRLEPSPLLGHDPSIQGWPWIAETHSWVEPTALAVIALTVTGRGDHPRTQEATALLRDRRLPHGGWNYGNTFFFGQELRPSPDSTGIALEALAGRVPRKEVRRSLDYLEAEVARLRTPLSLGWGLLGLGAWGGRPAAAVEWVRESLALQAELGSYDTALLALVLFGGQAEAGLTAELLGMAKTGR